VFVAVETQLARRFEEVALDAIGLSESDDADA
jgi:hypothetical protein